MLSGEILGATIVDACSAELFLGHVDPTNPAQARSLSDVYNDLPGHMKLNDVNSVKRVFENSPHNSWQGKFLVASYSDGAPTRYWQKTFIGQGDAAAWAAWARTQTTLWPTLPPCRRTCPTRACRLAGATKATRGWACACAASSTARTSTGRW